MTTAERFLIANWKMNLPAEGIEAYSNAVTARAGDSPEIQIVLAPPFPYISRVALAVAVSGTKVAVAGQNCSQERSGAFTGEVAASMLRDAGASFVIVGHSERRLIMSELNEMVGRKAAMAIANGLTPVICIGEEWPTREAGDAAAFLAKQLEGAWSQPLAGAPRLIVAYEPVWAIGTGRNASPPDVAQTVAGIRSSIRRLWAGVDADGIAILYGGSVTPDNVEELWSEGRVDGFLVGGASLDSGRFLKLLEAITPRQARSAGRS
jgi:triosephosphate isomerase